MLVFEERGNRPEYPEKTSQCRVENQQNSTHTPDLGIETGSHKQEACALTTAPYLHPCSVLK